MSKDSVKKKHVYFSVSGSKKVHLGTPENPNRKNLRLALAYLNDKLNKYEREYAKFDELLNPPRPLSTKYKLIIFDLDGVIYDKPWHEITSERVAVSTWDVLFQEMDIYPMHEKLKQRFEAREFTYMQWTAAACSALKMAGLRKETFERTILERPLTPGAEIALKRLSSATVVGCAEATHPIIGVISGSFDALAHRLKTIVPGILMEAHCTLEFDNKGALKDPPKIRPTDYEGKADIVRKWIKQLGVSREAVAYVGDDVNDKDAFNEVGLSIAFNAEKLRVRRAAKIKVDSRSFKSILPHLTDEAEPADVAPADSDLTASTTTV